MLEGPEKVWIIIPIQAPISSFRYRGDQEGNLATYNLWTTKVQLLRGPIVCMIDNCS